MCPRYSYPKVAQHIFVNLSLLLLGRIKIFCRQLESLTLSCSKFLSEFLRWSSPKKTRYGETFFNKLDADWTYLMVKVRQREKTQTLMEKILKNERTNEQTNERLSKRIEQNFMNEILSKTREIEENPFFRHDNRLFRQF